MAIYEEFLDWAESIGFEFPCTAGEFFARAASFSGGDQEIVASLCEQGIGPNWDEE